MDRPGKLTHLFSNQPPKAQPKLNWSAPNILFVVWALACILFGGIKLTESGLYVSHILLALMSAGSIIFRIGERKKVASDLGATLFVGIALLPIMAGVTDNTRFVSEQFKALLLVFGASCIGLFVTWERVRAVCLFLPPIVGAFAVFVWLAGLGVDYGSVEYADIGRFGVPAFGSPNSSAFVFVVMLAMVLFNASKVAKGRLLWFALAPVFLALLVLTGSDGGALMSVIVLARFAGVRMRPLFFGFVALIALIFLATIVYPSFEVPELVGSGRLYIWNYLIGELFSSDWANILFGMGPGAIDMDPWFTAQVVSAHSMYLEILYSYGLLGFLSLMVVLVLTAFQLVRADFPPKERTLLEAIYLILVAGALVDTYLLTAQLVWFGAMALAFFSLMTAPTPLTSQRPVQRHSGRNFTRNQPQLESSRR